MTTAIKGFEVTFNGYRKLVQKSLNEKSNLKFSHFQGDPWRRHKISATLNEKKWIFPSPIQYPLKSLLFLENIEIHNPRIKSNFPAWKSINAFCYLMQQNINLCVLKGMMPLLYTEKWYKYQKLNFFWRRMRFHKMNKILRVDMAWKLLILENEKLLFMKMNTVLPLPALQYSHSGTHDLTVKKLKFHFCDSSCFLSLLLLIGIFRFGKMNNVFY